MQRLKIKFARDLNKQTLLKSRASDLEDLIKDLSQKNEMLRAELNEKKKSLKWEKKENIEIQRKLDFFKKRTEILIKRASGP